MDLDVLDVKLIKALAKDGRRSYREIAKELKVSAVTVVKRVKQLRKGGAIQDFTIRTNPKEAGFGLTALINVNVRGQNLEQFEKEIAGHKNVLAVYDVTGEFDAVLVTRFPGITELNKFVKTVLKSTSVSHTRSQVVLNTVKEDLNACYA